MENMQIGLEVMVIGMGCVLVTLYLLSLVIQLIGYFFGTGQNNEQVISRDLSKQRMSSGQQEIDPLDVAVIAAAIYQEFSPQEYKIISIKSSNNSYWGNFNQTK